MECSMCNKEGSYIVAFYKNDGKVDFYEVRCKNHLIINKREIRKKIYKKPRHS